MKKIILIGFLIFGFFISCSQEPNYVPFELIKAVRAQDTSAVRSFLNNSETKVFVLKTTPEPFPLICEVIDEGYTDISRILIEYGSDVNQVCNKESWGMSPLHYAKDSSAVHLLISNGANIEMRNSAEETPLMSASRHGINQVVKELLRLGADVNAKNSANQTSLELAMTYGGDNETLELLRKAKMSKN